jgi:predicted ATPase/class 3 adenylate cyclase
VSERATSISAERQNGTFLFTDIERSSELWEKHPQAMGRALDQHDRLLRVVFLGNRGHAFKTMGDAFCVAFSSPSDAVLAAVAAQRALASAAWEETGPLRVRMAIHTGEAEHRDSDYFGPTLNRVARVLATSHGGQILLTRTVAETINVWLPPDISLRDLGERRLKDLSLPERIFQLVIQGLPSEFPPLRSLEILPNNLPAQVTSFVGRAREMVELKRLLDTTRLVTLTGPGGTGKTRLSLQLAAEILDKFPHGVWLVELATISDPALLAETISNAVDVREESGRPPLETLLEALRTRTLLLVLDNCEHLIAESAKIVSSLLRHCPGVKVMASSREPLNVQGETLWPVSALAVPNWSGSEPDLAFQEIAQLEAVHLFVERASLARPDFTLTKENANLVAKICWRLDGLPLALELAAARIKVLPLGQILERLDNRFRLLTGGSRTALPRQQTLGALIDWSYDLLAEPERILLRRLAVFVAGRTLEMVEKVCSGDGIEQAQVFDLLCSLTEKSLLMTEPGAVGENRYTMLESIWDYADDKLQQHGEKERYYQKHLDFFVSFAEKAEPKLFGADQKIWLEKLSVENHNLNRALQTSLVKPETVGLGLRLAGALSRYWEIRSYLTEGYDQFVELLRRVDDSIPAEVIAKVELGAATVSWCQDRNDDATLHFERASRLYESMGVLEQVGVIEGYLGSAQRNEGNYPRARAHFERTEALAKSLSSERLRALAIYGFSGLFDPKDNLSESRAMKEEAIRIYESFGDQWVAGLMKGGLAEICLLQGDYAEARRLIVDVLTISREFGSKWSVPYAIEWLANICAVEGQGPKAVRLYGAASTQREAMALRFSPAQRNFFQHSMEMLHERVPEPIFKEEWEKGKALSFQAAIILAVEPETS